MCQSCAVEHGRRHQGMKRLRKRKTVTKTRLEKAERRGLENDEAQREGAY